jgi:hypothetical protein
MILEEQPIIVMVDGSNSYARGKDARYPDAQKGFTNWGIVLNDVLGVEQGEMQRTDDHITGLRETGAYTTLRTRMEGYGVSVSDVEQYNVHYWNPAGTSLALTKGMHAEREVVTKVSVTQASEVDGPSVIVINSVFNDGYAGVRLPADVKAKGNNKQHESAYYDDTHHIQSILFKKGSQGIEIQDEIYGAIRDEFTDFKNQDSPLYTAVEDSGLLTHKQATEMRLHRLQHYSVEIATQKLLGKLSRRGITLNDNQIADLIVIIQIQQIYTDRQVSSSEVARDIAQEEVREAAETYLRDPVVIEYGTSCRSACVIGAELDERITGVEEGRHEDLDQVVVSDGYRLSVAANIIDNLGDPKNSGNEQALIDEASELLDSVDGDFPAEAFARDQLMDELLEADVVDEGTTPTTFIEEIVYEPEEPSGSTLELVVTESVTAAKVAEEQPLIGVPIDDSVTTEQYEIALGDKLQRSQPVDTAVKFDQVITGLSRDHSSREIVEALYTVFYQTYYVDPRGAYSKGDVQFNPRNILSPQNVENGLEQLVEDDEKRKNMKELAENLYELSTLEIETSLGVSSVNSLESLLLFYGLSYEDMLQLFEAAVVYGTSEGSFLEFTTELINNLDQFNSELNSHQAQVGLSQDAKVVSFLGDAELVFTYGHLSNPDSSQELAYVGRLQMMTPTERANYHRAMEIFEELEQSPPYINLMYYVENFETLKETTSQEQLAEEIERALSDPELLGLLNELVGLGIYNPSGTKKVRYLFVFEKYSAQDDKLVRKKNEINSMFGFFSRINLLKHNNGERIIDGGIVYRTLFNKDSVGTGLFMQASNGVTSPPQTIAAYQEFQERFTDLLKLELESNPEFAERAWELYDSLALAEEDAVFVDTGFKGTIPMLFAALHSIRYPESNSAVFLYGVIGRWANVVPHSSDNELDVVKLEEAGRFMQTGGFDETEQPLVAQSSISDTFMAEMTLNAVQQSLAVGP